MKPCEQAVRLSYSMLQFTGSSVRPFTGLHFSHRLYDLLMSRLSITWLGHATFVIVTPGGKRIVTDPWLEGNPACPADKKKIDAADVILLTHGHSDHSGDVVNVARATN